MVLYRVYDSRKYTFSHETTMMFHDPNKCVHNALNIICCVFAVKDHVDDDEKQKRVCHNIRWRKVIDI